VRVARRSLPALADLVGERALREAEELDEPGGWHRLRLLVDWPHEVPGRLVALGGDLEILDPPEMRERALALAREVVERYADVS
jgi:hypothetical protein